MTSKLKCPFCGEELGGNMAEPCCRNQNCEMNAIPIPRTIWETLDDYKHNYSVKSEQHERGYAYATKTIKDLESKLEIAQKALKELWQATHYDTDGYLGKTIQQALKQIDHFADVSKMIEQRNRNE